MVGDVDPVEHQLVKQLGEPAAKKRRTGTSPTARTLDRCRKLGWEADVVERSFRIPGRRSFKRDLFGVIDIVAMTPEGIIGIQATANSSGHHADHRAKIENEPRAKRWVDNGAALELWSWAKQGPRGKPKRWVLRVERYARAVDNDAFCWVEVTR